MKFVIACFMIAVCLVGCFDFMASSKDEDKDVSSIGNSLHLSWDQPLFYEDESEIEVKDILSFYIYWGESENNLDNEEPVMPNLREVTLSGIPEGTYYFAVAVETTDGNRSLLSNIESKTFN